MLVCGVAVFYVLLPDSGRNGQLYVCSFRGSGESGCGFFFVRWVGGIGN